MSDTQLWVLVGCAVISTVALFFVAHNVEKIARSASSIAELLRQIRNLLEKR